MTEEEVIQKLKDEGYDKVYAYSAEPNEDDPEHSHEFDTKVHVISGEIGIRKLDGDRITDYKLKAGDECEVLRNTKHEALCGPEGCRYIVAEKH